MVLGISGVWEKNPITIALRLWSQEPGRKSRGKDLLSPDQLGMSWERGTSINIASSLIARQTSAL